MLLNGISKRPFTFSFARNCFGFCIATGVVAAAEIAMAATVNVSKDLSSPLSTTAIASFDTDGSKMAGMIVTAGFADGTSQSAIWATTQPGFGRAVVLDWFVLDVGNTANSSWLLFNLNPNSLLTRLTIDAGAGSTVFDLSSPTPGTDGSAGGTTFSDAVVVGGSVSVTYSRPVGLTGFAPVGDLFAAMAADFIGLEGGGVSSALPSGFWFRQDTDNIARIGDLVPVDPTPVPGAAFLMGSVIAGGAGFGAWRRKRISFGKQRT